MNEIENPFKSLEDEEEGFGSPRLKEQSNKGIKHEIKLKIEKEEQENTENIDKEVKIVKMNPKNESNESTSPTQQKNKSKRGLKHLSMQLNFAKQNSVENIKLLPRTNSKLTSPPIEPIKDLPPTFGKNVPLSQNTTQKYENWGKNFKDKKSRQQQQQQQVQRSQSYRVDKLDEDKEANIITSSSKEINNKLKKKGSLVIKPKHRTFIPQLSRTMTMDNNIRRKSIDVEDKFFKG